MTAALCIVRLALAIIFALAGVAKLVNRTDTRRALREFGVPEPLLGAGAVALPVSELVVAGLLVPTSTARIGAALGALLLLSFSVAIGWALKHGKRPNCNCFGRLRTSPASGRTLARDLVLCAASLLMVVAGPGRSAGSLATVQAMAIAGAALIVVLVTLESWLLYQLFHQNRRLLERVRLVESTIANAPDIDPGRTELSEGVAAPLFELPTLDGGRLGLEELLAARRPLALVFVEPDCGACEPVIIDLADLAAERAGDVGVAVLSRDGVTGDPLPHYYDVHPVLLQRHREVALAYGVTAVPSAVLVTPEGRIASPVAVGGAAIIRLLVAAFPRELVPAPALS
jgi:uncharacterized membrane protein YphA (DoxX/SURF4 family)